MFLTQPDTPRFVASSAIEALKKTPCTTPVIFSLTAVLAKVQQPLLRGVFAVPQSACELEGDMTGSCQRKANKYSVEVSKRNTGTWVDIVEAPNPKRYILIGQA